MESALKTTPGLVWHGGRSRAETMTLLGDVRRRARLARSRPRRQPRALDQGARVRRAGSAGHPRPHPDARGPAGCRLPAVRRRRRVGGRRGGGHDRSSGPSPGRRAVSRRGGAVHPGAGRRAGPGPARGRLSAGGLARRSDAAPAGGGRRARLQVHDPADGALGGHRRAGGPGRRLARARAARHGPAARSWSTGPTSSSASGAARTPSGTPSTSGPTSACTSACTASSSTGRGRPRSTSAASTGSSASRRTTPT